ncbi:LysR substrate-binding domain-containing protein [Colwellia sp. 12G3]|uniref:LysR substrate-binding domain-containing protein n=1 Tax=Colwellia sp. 12G3 TaxID=2058299 RepID=UPI000C32E671|nr:LysR substrate-binding domain-containing protein [Colwellia sp. 12G3]PKI17214.1 hypothetical protein CXF71_05165 [Colwellia sp. 12G3]
MQYSVGVSGRFSANDSGVLLQAAVNDITMLPKSSVLPYLSIGQLEVVLPKYQPNTLGIHCVYSSRDHMPLSVRTFIDTLIIELKKLDI